MNLFGYIRVSGAGQVDKDGPDRQRAAFQAFCEQNKLPAEGSHFSEFFEAAVTGTTSDRPEFAKILEVAQPGDAIVVERLDRLARDLMVQEFLLKECRTRGIKLFATDQGLVDIASDGGDPTRKLIRQVLGALAEWEKSALVMKLRKARDRKRQQEGRCEGPAPYGTTDSTEQRIVEIVWSLRQKGFSYQKIQDGLKDAHLYPRNGRRTWNRSMLHKMIKRKERQMNHTDR